MLGDPTKVRFQLWFIPESGIEQPPSIVNQVVGYAAASAAARSFMAGDFKEPEFYGQMYDEAHAMLDRWYADPNKWSLALPVHYGTLVIA